MRIIDADELKKHQVEGYQANGVELEPVMLVHVSTIDNAPTVPNEYMRGYEAAEREYKRPQDEWKLDSLGAYCPECGTHPDYTSNYCPNCGADMRGGTEK